MNTYALPESGSRKAFLTVGGALIVQFAASMLFSYIVFLPLMKSGKLESFMESIGPYAVLLLTYIPAFIGVLAFWFAVRRMPVFKKQGEKLGAKNTIQIFLMTYAVSILINGIGTKLSTMSPAGGTEALDQLSTVVSTGNVVAIMIPVLFAPVFEEMVFRKMILDRISGYGETTAIVFSAISFGLFHHNLTQFMYAFSVGLFLGYVYCKTRKVIVTIVMHSILNLFGSVIMLAMPLVTSNKASFLAKAVVVLIFMMMAAMIISGIITFIIWIVKKRFKPDNSMTTCIPRKYVFKKVYLIPTVVFYFGLCISAVVLDLLNIRI